jgi:hypothetical protein
MDKKIVKKQIQETKVPNNVIIPIQEKEEKPKQDNQIDIVEVDEQWNMCCLKCEVGLIVYLGKYIISLLVLLFCMYMLQDSNNQGKEYYSAQISFILGVYVGVQGNNNNNHSNNSKNDKKE